MTPHTKLITAPASEPVTLTEVKAQCRVTHSSEDTMLTSLITVAREALEIITAPLITQTWDAFYPAFPSDWLELPWRTTSAVTAFEWTDNTGTVSSWAVSGSDLVDGSTVKAHIDTVRQPRRIVLAYAQSWPTVTLKTSLPLRVRVTAGYGSASAVPTPLKQAILLHIGHLYENRESVAFSDTRAVAAMVPHAYKSLIANYRRAL